MSIDIEKIALTLLLGLSITNISNAKTIQTVMCPSITKIHQSVSIINSAYEIPGHDNEYIAGSAFQTRFYDNKVYWGMNIDDVIIANSVAEAIVKAQKIVTQIVISEAEMANEWPEGNYHCHYYGLTDDVITKMTIMGGKKPNQASLPPFVYRHFIK